MKYRVCKYCLDTFIDFIGNDCCELCNREIVSGETGWLELNQKEEVKNGRK